MGNQSGGGLINRLIVGVVMGIIALITFFSSAQFNNITGEKQYLSLTVDQEIALGLQSAPSMIDQFGGLYNNARVQQAVTAIGQRLVSRSAARTSPWQFEFHVLNAPQVVNAFALPGGQVFITTGLLNRLAREDMIAGVLGHEIVHVLARHGAQQIAKSELTNGLLGAVAVASGDANQAQFAQVVGQLINLRYGRQAETQSDTLGACIMIEAGYDPQAMIDVMKVLQSVSGGQRQPEFMSSHPDPGNRIENLQDVIQNQSSVCAKIWSATTN